MKLRNALLAATLLAAPAAVKAQPVTGPYVSLGAGWNYLQDRDVRTMSVGGVGIGTGNSQVKFGSGWVGLGSLGYGLGNGLRIELEGDYRQNSAHGTLGDGLSSVHAHGQEQKYGAMVNVLYDFNTGAFGSLPFLPTFSPYVGVGVGYQRVALHSFNLYGPGAFPNIGDQGRDALGYQAILGAAVDLNAMMPGLALTLEYRFLGTVGNKAYSGDSDFFGSRLPFRSSLKLGDDFNHSVLVGLRYNFGAAPPPPPPAPAPAPVAAPAPAPARTYLVFFDWDRADLTARARQIIAEAAQASTRVQYTRIEVNGYTDRSGTPAYNQRLSVRRAEAVRSELVRDGVPQQAIEIHGYGETHPLVPTAPGVREPQNRRVEIILR